MQSKRTAGRAAHTHCSGTMPASAQERSAGTGAKSLFPRPSHSIEIQPYPRGFRPPIFSTDGSLQIHRDPAQLKVVDNRASEGLAVDI